MIKEEKMYLFLFLLLNYYYLLNLAYIYSRSIFCRKEHFQNAQIILNTISVVMYSIYYALMVFQCQFNT